MKKFYLFTCVLFYLFLISVEPIFTQGWYPQTSGVSTALRGVYFTDSLTGTIVGSSGKILRTTNGGNLWTNQSSGTSNHLSGIYFPTPTNATSAGSNGTIIHTTNSGTNWMSQTSGITNNLNDVFFTDINKGTIVGASGKILLTTNSGINWIPKPSGTSNNLNAVYYTSATTGIVVGTGGTILRTTNSGNSWSSLTSGTTESLNDVYFAGPDIGIIVGANGLVLRTTNSGTTWSNQTSGTTYKLQSVHLVDSNIGIAVGDSGTILRTSDGGISWVSQESGTDEALFSVFFTDKWIGTAIGADGTILRTMTGGTGPYIIIATAVGNGTITPSDSVSVNIGADQLFTISPNSGFHVDSVLVDGVNQGATGSYTFFNVSSYHTITAYFSINQYTLTISSTNGSVAKEPDQALYDSGSTVQLTAIPATGYHFVSWSGDASGSDNPLTITMTGNKTITANFAINQYTLTINSTNGTVTKEPEQALYDSGSTVQLTAIPATGYHFVSWSGDASGSTNPLTVTMTGNKSITANFAINQYTLTVNATNGTVTKEPEQALYDSGSTVQLTAIPASGYNFVSWSGDASGSTNPLTVTMTGNKSITANFAINQYTLTVNATNGTVTKEPDQALYDSGSTVQLTAIPATGYHFVSWSGDASGSTNPLTVTMTGNKSITANFAINQYTLTINSTNGTVTKEPEQALYDSGSTVQLTAIPASGYNFVSWSGDASGSTNPLTVTMTGNKSITANFAINQYSLTVNATNGTVTKEPEQALYDSGSTVQLTAIPATGYHFVSWSGDASGSTNPLTIVMDSDKNITANFLMNTYTISASAGLNGSINPAGNIVVNHGANQLFTFTANPGFHVADVIVDGSSIGIVPSYEFVNVTTNRTISVSFAPNPISPTYTINASAGPHGKVDPSGSITVDEGENRSFTITPNAHYHIDSVYIDGTFIGAITNYTFTNVMANHTIHATFTIDTYSLEVSVSGEGSVIKDPDNPRYDYGTTVHLTAVPSDLSWKFSGWSGDINGMTNPVDIIMDVNKVITATFLRDSVYLVSYRSFVAESIALDKDNKGKIGKYVKRKPTIVKFCCEIPNNTGKSFTSIHVHFSPGIILNQPNYPFVVTPTPSQINFIKSNHLAELIWDDSIDNGESFTICGWGERGKFESITYAWHSFAGGKHSNAIFSLNELRVPMPNRVNAVHEIFLQQGFSSNGGLLVGEARNDSSKYYGWLLATKYNDVMKTLYHKRGIHTEGPRGFDVFTSNNKPLLKRQKSLPPNKHNNKLLADMVALKLNIVASQLGITTNGFGELIYDDGSSNPLNGKTIFDISRWIDSVMMGYYEDGKHKFADNSILNEINTVVRNINQAFEGPVDTVNFSQTLIYKGVHPLIDVSYLRANPEAMPRKFAPAKIILPEMPDVYALHQNYPNPFNPITTIQFDLPTEAIVTLKIYNLLGQEVMTMIDHEIMDEGFQEIDFDATDLSSGIYFYRIIADKIGDREEDGQNSSFVCVKKMVLLR